MEQDWVNNGRPIPSLVLSDQEKVELEKTVRRRSAIQSDAQRAKAMVLCASGLPDYEVAKQTGVSSLNVGRWRQRLVEHRLRGLLDLPSVHLDCLRRPDPRNG